MLFYFIGFPKDCLQTFPHVFLVSSMLFFFNEFPHISAFLCRIITSGVLELIPHFFPYWAYPNQQPRTLSRRHRDWTFNNHVSVHKMLKRKFSHGHALQLNNMPQRTYSGHTNGHTNTYVRTDGYILAVLLAVGVNAMHVYVCQVKIWNFLSLHQFTKYEIVWSLVRFRNK